MAIPNRQIPPFNFFYNIDIVSKFKLYLYVHFKHSKNNVISFRQYQKKITVKKRAFTTTGKTIIKIAFYFKTLLIAIAGMGQSHERAVELTEIAEAKYAKNELDSAVFYYVSAAGIFHTIGDFNDEAGIYNTIGNIYLGIADRTKALDWFIKSVEVYEQKTDNSKSLSRPLANIAVVQNSLGNNEQALTYAGRSRQIALKLEDTLVLTFTQRLIGRIYRRLERYNEAVEEIKGVLPYYRNSGDWANMSETLANLANIYFDMEDYQNSLLHIDSAFYFARKVNDSRNIAYAYHTRGFILHRTKNFREAMANFDSSTVISRKIPDLYLTLDNYKAVTEIKKEMNDLHGYVKYIQLYIGLRDSMDIVNQKALADELEAKYQNQVKQGEIDILLLEQELLASNLRRQKNARHGITFTLLVVIIFSIILINRFRVLSATRRQLDAEKLRNNIARDLHDDLGSTLSSINIISQMALQNGHDNPKDLFVNIGNHTSKMMDKLSDIVWSINPQNDSLEQVLFKMRDFAAEILEPKGINYRFKVDKSICDLKPDLEKRKALYLIFKEAVNNAAKYSNAQHLEIYLCQKNGQLHLLVKDKGKGFDISTVKKGNGLQNMLSRAASLGAVLSINSQPQLGTEVNLQMPVT
jgi:two-component system, NarL family, sensor histidine kinase UhpB